MANTPQPAARPNTNTHINKGPDKMNILAAAAFSAPAAAAFASGAEACPDYTQFGAS